MVASIVFGLAALVVFVLIQLVKPGKSLFDRH
jgi:hypothetical protein